MPERCTPPRAEPRLSRLAVVALVPLLLAAGCKDKAAEASDGPGADSAEAADPGRLSLPVAGAPVRRGDLVLTITTTGQVRSAAVAQLKAETNGTVTEVLVRPGQAVTRGELLVRLDTRPFDLAIREAEAALAEAKIRYQGNLASDSILLGAGQEGERRQNALTLSGVPAAQVRLERAELDRERAQIVAPFDGVVERVEVAAGSRTGPGENIATIVDVTNLRVEAQVLEHDLPLIKVGGQAFVSTPGTPQPIPGRVSAVLPLVDTAARAGTVVVTVAGGQTQHAAALRPGMYADLKLEATRLPNRIIVPARAVIERDGRPLVFMVKGGRAQWVYILPGRSNALETEVLADSTSGVIPLAVGDTVLVEGHLTLTHDAPVRVIAAAERR